MPENEVDPRRYPSRPVAGVGGVLVDVAAQRVLLVQRGKPPLQGQWSLPGGGMEAGEYAMDALRREMQEETGLVVEPLMLFEVFERILRDDAGRVEYQYLLLDYLCEIRGGQLQAGSDVSAVRWFAREELSSAAITSGTLEVVTRALNGELVFRHSRI
jgi:8-oxo-dGTP diphosphatase